MQVQSVVETLGRQVEEETKEREVMEEKLEMERLEKVFLEEQTQTMQQALRDKSSHLLQSQAKLQVGGHWSWFLWGVLKGFFVSFLGGNF